MYYTHSLLYAVPNEQSVIVIIQLHCPLPHVGPYTAKVIVKNKMSRFYGSLCIYVLVK